MAKSILVVDDSNSIRQMVSFTLTREGYAIVEATNGRDGLKEAQAKNFDLVLTDQNMPIMTGLEMTKSLRQLPGYKTTPILILTTESSDAIKQEGRAAGATGWLVKPFDPKKLTDLVKKLIG